MKHQTTLIKWEDRFNTGIDEIDRQHRKLVALINEFGMICGKAGEKEISQLLDAMVDYAVYHFQTEEKQFLVKTPYLDGHLDEHQFFTDNTARFGRTFQEDTARAAGDLLGFLVTWLKNHILETDRVHLAGFLKTAPDTAGKKQV